MAEEGTIMKSKPVDGDLNRTTRSLFDALHCATGEFAMLGHQNETSNVIGENTDSDVHAVTGSYPAVWGNDLGGVELDQNRNLDGFGAEAIRSEMLRAFNMGAINTLSWHSANPLTLGGYGHNMAEGTVEAVLPGGEAHGKFLGWLDRIAAALTTITDANGEPIPIIFRPFHEHTGDWFWWCTGSPDHPTDTTPEQFVALWRMTVEYLRDTKHVHNVLYAYSPDRSRIDMSTPESRETGYLYAYPGDEYVDVLGFDDYWDIAPAETSAEDPQARHADLIAMLTLVGRLGEERGKLAAATEVGSPGIFADSYACDSHDLTIVGQSDATAAEVGSPSPDSPWTKYLLTAALANEYTRRALWYLPWRNDPNAAGTGAYGTPVAGSRYADDFRRFVRHDFIRLADALPPLYK
ncbi:glycoside hydrolase family 26 protein [Bifidobacterium moukalabense]|uniref:Mannan endo-1,4-beta-mannosidase n=1 Tax=Bifidobacterium moukalabense DSM 27321 TaxID=1435051 RepID=W4NAY5_9BIFI|nr:glycosyl hydrolase [Bifidobacterium moukalabense]ETY71825.1 mannan endo-1,4-beta-mannosidase [Bifidobacterium moukalabense DSM 27321]